ncbi:MAG: KamA family radical SAM protein [Acidobacteria bacterium]|nr:KamA family radical SAM protein [Acidobacteriota bacterium]
MYLKETTYKEFYYPNVSGIEWNDYRWQLKNRISDLSTLDHFLKIKKETFNKLKKYETKLNISITPYYLSLINPKDKNDPVKKQCVPLPEEFECGEGLIDPLAEKANMPLEDVIHKYPDRALLVLSNVCPVYCRHCFRRGEWGKNKNINLKERIQKAVEYFKKNKSIKEAIISGGEPLLFSDSLIEFLLKELRKISNVEIIRIASRIPVVLPQRITQNLCSILKKYSPIWLVTHFNHFQEITEEAEESIEKLVSSKAIVLNQTVLLRGINDNADTLEKLFRNLIKIGVKPYYLFQCDPAKGVSHFRTSVFEGLEIMENLAGKITGLAQPTFALDTEGGGKVPLLPNYILSCKEGLIEVKNYQGKRFCYKNSTQKKRIPSLIRKKIKR